MSPATNEPARVVLCTQLLDTPRDVHKKPHSPTLTLPFAYSGYTSATLKLRVRLGHEKLVVGLLHKVHARTPYATASVEGISNVCIHPRNCGRIFRGGVRARGPPPHFSRPTPNMKRIAPPCPSGPRVDLASLLQRTSEKSLKAK